MTLARKNQVCLESTKHYHLVNRCVRRSFLCGFDKLTGIDYSHRKQWFLDYLCYLLESFSMHVCAHAVMSNHYHLVVYVDDDKAKSWTREDVIARCSRLFNTRRMEDLLKTSSELTAEQEEEIQRTIETWRERLYSLSWLEKCLNEHIAHRANKEDKVNGRFWQGRFKSQPLLDAAALVTCMTYVDLNPIRAGLAQSLDEADFTSIQQRLRQYRAEQEEQTTPESKAIQSTIEVCTKREAGGGKRKKKFKTVFTPVPLMPLLDQAMLLADSPMALPLSRHDYFQLVDATGRQLQEDKHGHIHDGVPPILCALGIKPDRWMQSIRDFEHRFPGAFGAIEAIDAYIGKLKNRCWCVGKKSCGELFG